MGSALKIVVRASRPRWLRRRCERIKTAHAKARRRAKRKSFPCFAAFVYFAALRETGQSPHGFITRFGCACHRGRDARATRVWPAPCLFVLCTFCIFLLTGQPFYDSLLRWSKKGTGRPQVDARRDRWQGRLEQTGAKKGGGKSQKMFFDETNSPIYCKYKTYRLSVRKTNSFFVPFNPKRTPKTGQSSTHCTQSNSNSRTARPGRAAE